MRINFVRFKEKRQFISTILSLNKTRTFMISHGFLSNKIGMFLLWNWSSNRERMEGMTRVMSFCMIKRLNVCAYT